MQQDGGVSESQVWSKFKLQQPNQLHLDSSSDNCHCQHDLALLGAKKPP